MSFSVNTEDELSGAIVTIFELMISIWDHYTAQKMKFSIKGTHSGLRQFLAAERPLEMMKNAFCFTSKGLFVLKIFKLLSWHFGHVAKRLDKKDKVNFKFFDVTAWLKNNCDTHIAQYLEK